MQSQMIKIKPMNASGSLFFMVIFLIYTFPVNAHTEKIISVKAEVYERALLQSLKGATSIYVQYHLWSWLIYAIRWNEIANNVTNTKANKCL